MSRSRKRIQLWKKAAIHFSLCFVMGFFSGFAPTSTASIFSGQANPYRSTKNLGISAQLAPQPLQNPSENNRSLMSSEVAENPANSSATHRSTADELSPRNLLIVITTSKPNDRFSGPFLRRLGNTLKLVSSPLLWIIVEASNEASNNAELLRTTGIMYRHLTYKENFTDAKAEADHQRNVALNHIEYHRLNGIVHFAEVSNTYNLEFFDEIREIDTFGTWPMAMMSANRRRVVVEGPMCRSSKVVGWQLKDLSNHTSDTSNPIPSPDANNGGIAERKHARINISGFAFNSSILWDPERWGRPSSVLDTSQDSIKFVQEVVLEDESKLKAIPSDCSKIMLWHLHIPRTLTTSPSSSQSKNRR
ncbi:uncharacterized protein A4U43_C07F3870 [Asparagus officinalis]|uniref:Glycosyltransferases n=1 Tax=Asparagus officinalis TaxID=4686 RepID=A0A5P1ECC5_ASPOF|nr:probable beta-1,4-xylosyltransferase IRX9 [Asparagus officinalis]ONK62439.1 uncharacterized protein A4U43_C07F3870 [Asparagus officinalis]